MKHHGFFPQFLERILQEDGWGGNSYLECWSAALARYRRGRRGTQGSAATSGRTRRATRPSRASDCDLHSTRNDYSCYHVATSRITPSNLRHHPNIDAIPFYSNLIPPAQLHPVLITVPLWVTSDVRLEPSLV